MCNIRVFYLLRELYEADFHKPGIYGSVRVWANPGSMEAGEYRQTRGARFVAVCLEVVVVAGLMWVSWCVFGEAGFFLVSQVTTSFFKLVHEYTTPGCETSRQQLASTR